MRKSATGAPFPIRVAHAPRVLANASRVRGLFSRACRVGKVRFGEAPKPARGARALPGLPRNGFTLIELLVVMAIILVLAGLILSISGYVQKKGARSRAEAEIAAMSAAIESYKADNGIYPQSTATNALDPFTAAGPTATPHPNAYENASRSLYGALSGDNVNYNNQLDGTETANRTYLSFKPQMLGGTKNSSGNLTAVDMIRDPFGNSYGYSTMKASNPAGSGSNPTFDLWSIADGDAGADAAKWVKNW